LYWNFILHYGIKWFGSLLGKVTFQAALTYLYSSQCLPSISMPRTEQKRRCAISHPNHLKWALTIPRLPQTHLIGFLEKVQVSNPSFSALTTACRSGCIRQLTSGLYTSLDMRGVFLECHSNSFSMWLGEYSDLPTRTFLQNSSPFVRTHCTYYVL
jgi:hypothetical protein